VSDNFYPEHGGVLRVSKDACIVWIISCHGDRPIIRSMSITGEDLKKKSGIKKEMNGCAIKRKSLSLRRFFESSRVMGNKESNFILSNTNNN
jgi:hypothetical protein